MENLDVDDWKKVENPVSKRLMCFEESLHCPICFEVAANPVVIKVCGHTFCSICVRRHFDDNVNSISHNQCPQCKAKCSASDIVTNHQLAHTILTYKGLRNELLNELTNRAAGHNNGSSSANGKGGHGTKLGKQNNGAKIETKLGMKSFHQKGKKYIIDALNDVCKPSKIKPKNVGDERDLARIYREIIHLHNAQINALEPLTFDAVINEINRKEEVRHTTSRSYSHNHASLRSHVLFHQPSPHTFSHTHMSPTSLTTYNNN